MQAKPVLEEGAATWLYHGELIIAEPRDLEQVLFTSARTGVVALGPERALLYGIGLDGTLKFEVQAPAGYSFSYLTQHPDLGTAVVCGAESEVEGWFDWHFSIDEESGALHRYCPAY